MGRLGRCTRGRSMFVAESRPNRDARTMPGCAHLLPPCAARASHDSNPPPRPSPTRREGEIGQGTRRARAIRRLRRPVHPRNADGSGRGTGVGLRCGATRSRLSTRLRVAVAVIQRTANAHLSGGSAQRARRRSAALAEAGGSLPHRRAQDQQRARPGAAGPTDGQAADHRRNWRRQHGVAVATVCAKFGLDCEVYMGVDDMARQAINVDKMRLLGATVTPVESGSKTLKDATNEAIRDWVTNVRTTHYVIGSAVGPHPYPLMVREFQSVIGREARAQMIVETGRLPTVVVACVGGGSNAIGIFAPFYDDPVRLVGVEAAGRGLNSGAHAASIVGGRPGVLHGSFSYLLQDEDGQVLATHSISAGPDYPGVGPEHALLPDQPRAEYVS